MDILERKHTTKGTLDALRDWLAREGMQAFILPVTDEFQGEYPAEYARRVAWVCGFDGSAGALVITLDAAALFVDGRYTLQAAQQVDPAQITVYNSTETSAGDWLTSQLGEGQALGYDAWLHTAQQVEILRAKIEAAGALCMALESNPVDRLWNDQPSRPAEKVVAHPEELAGESAESKCHRLAKMLKEKKAAAALITLPDSLCWLLNIRGGDIPFNPLPLCYGLLHVDGSVDLFLEQPEAQLAQGVLPTLARVRSRIRLSESLAGLAGQRVLYDPLRSAIGFRRALEKAGAEIVEGNDPCILPKAIKNAVEIEGMRRAHREDGRAVSAFLRWFAEVPEHATITELEVVEKLESCRREGNGYLQPSFATIAGSGPNGAIVHYRATPESNRTIAPGEVLLLDSGGQYPYGTTDITRTVVRGAPSAEFRTHFTLVLKGHIALARAVFPEGTTGSQLDALARQYLWAEALDYDHGTGHGVGAYLCVHEGPQRISKRGGDAPLKPGMILSNEPGYYREGEYGIRIENLVLVVEKETGTERKFYGFETLTRVPIDRRLVVEALLTPEEAAWLAAYNAMCEE